MRSKTLKNNIFSFLGRNLIIRSFEIPHSIWKLHKDFKSVFFLNFDKKQKSSRLNGKNHCSKNGCLALLIELWKFQEFPHKIKNFTTKKTVHIWAIMGKNQPILKFAAKHQWKKMIFIYFLVVQILFSCPKIIPTCSIVWRKLSQAWLSSTSSSIELRFCCIIMFPSYSSNKTPLCLDYSGASRTEGFPSVPDL